MRFRTAGMIFRWVVVIIGAYLGMLKHKVLGGGKRG